MIPMDQALRRSRLPQDQARSLSKRPDMLVHPHKTQSLVLLQCQHQCQPLKVQQPLPTRPHQQEALFKTSKTALHQHKARP
mmetsp:Transcript_40129/g.103888  ORF Transcript_40129/g.103888 Transcript_40129/m.103888 type:complete len:81 (-) Transcript_40129:348-590(-)